MAATMTLSDGEPRRFRLRTKFLFVLGVLLSAIVLAVILVPKRQYALLLSEKLVSQARNAGLNVAVSEPELTMTGFNAQQISVFVPRILSTFTFSKVRVRLGMLSLATGSLSVAADGEIFGGSISATVDRGLSGGDIKLSFEAKGLQAAQAPQLQAFGVESGSLGASITDAIVSERAVPLSGNWSIGIENLSKSQDTFIQLPAKAGGGFIAIPAVREFKVAASGRLSPTEISINSAESSSSLGTAQLNGTIGISAAAVMGLTGKATLSPESQRKYGAFLPLVSNNLLQATATDIALRVTGTLRRPQLLILPP